MCFEVCVDVLVMHTGLFTSRTTRAPVVRALVGGRIEAAVCGDAQSVAAGNHVLYLTRYACGFGFYSPVLEERRGGI